jgi:hypothetical protein
MGDPADDGQAAAIRAQPLLHFGLAHYPSIVLPVYCAAAISALAGIPLGGS